MFELFIKFLFDAFSKGSLVMNVYIGEDVFTSNNDHIRAKKKTTPVLRFATRAAAAVAKVVLLLHVYRAFGIFYEAMQIL